MADQMIFPIGFDLETAVKKASSDWNGKYADQLEKAIQRRALEVRLRVSKLNFESLDDVKRRLASLKIEPITPETKTAIKELARELNVLAKALESVKRYSAKSAGAAELRGAKLTTEAEKAKAQAALASQRAARAEYNLAAARLKDAEAANGGTRATERLSRTYQKQDGYISRLIKRLAVYAGFQQISNFLTNVREVTAQFELQRVSLGAIIQDQTKANALFSEIKQFALKSPVSILDLTKYTKQLAAYKIGYDELFETTKRLTDVSVGLSVPLERIILFYGQVRAKGWLTAQDLKQATEAGIPLTEELAKKLSAVNGELVTAGQVMDMISKRQISFEQVKEVFDDMTSAGGMFYNMQEKQGNTLFGLWAKLGDAASVMYDEIGNTEDVNEGMKSAIEGLTELIRNWRSWAKTAATMGSIFSVTAASVYLYTTALKANTIAKKANTAESIAARTENIKGNVVLRLTNSLLQRCGVSANKATAYTVAFSKALRLIGTVSFGVVIAGVTWLVEKCFEAYENAHRLSNALKEIETESGIEQMKSVRNFEALATVAVEAADGSKKQKDALDELLRTYKDIIPQERLTIENLRAMKGNYDSLTESIKNYVAEQMKQKQINSVLEITGNAMIEKTREIQDIMKDTWSYEQIARFVSAYEQILRGNPGISAAKAMKKAAEDTGVGWQKMLSLGAITRDQLAAALRSYASSLKEQITQVNALDAAWNNNYMALGKYGKGYEDLANKVKNNPIEMGGNAEFDENKTPYFYKHQQQNLEILKVMIPTLKQIMSDANVTWQDGWANIVSTIDTAQPQIISSIDFNAINKYLQDNIGVLTDEQRKAIEKLQEMYLNIGMPSEVVQYNRKVAIDLANSMSDALSKIGDGKRTALDNITKYFMTSGQSVNDYAKTLDDALKDLKDRIAELSAVGLLLSPEGRKELEDLQTAAEFVEKLSSLISTAVATNDRGSGRKSDPRLQTLQEIANKMAEVNKEYDELLKKEGQTKALADTQKLFASSFKQMEDVAKKYNFKLPAFEVPQTVADVQKWYKAISDEIKRLGIKNADKVLIELGFKSDKAAIDRQQKDIEKQLKSLADRISRTKTAREFYEKILSQSGDMRLALRLSTDIFGGDGSALNKQIAEQVRSMVSKTSATLPDAVFNADFSLNSKAMRRWAEENKDLLGDTYNELVKMADEADKDMAKTIEGWLKATEKAKTYGDKLTDTYRKTSTEIERIQAAMANGKLDSAVGSDLIKGYRRKEAEEIAQLQYEAFKESPLYVQMFDDLDHASTKMLKNMKSRLIEMKGQWRNLDPTQLKEMQSRLNEIDAQLAKRNPFKTLADGLREYIKLRTKGDARGNTSRNMADNDMLRWADAYTKAQEELAAVMNDNDATEAQIAGAKQMVDYTKRQKEEAERTAENWKKVEDSIGLSAGELMQMLNWAGDIAGAIADISEAMGADAEDVQYWDNVASALGDISAGIQDIVQSAMSGNVVGVVSSVLTAIPKMFVGFSNLFSAGKIRKANKEIKRQQELLDQLEYTYSRLEKAADRLFGGDYISNYNKQMQVLQAQQTAYLRMAEAERSKGKKEDKAKTQEYLNQARDVADRIKDMESDLTAHFTGTDRASAAREFARSWLEAKATFASTSDAIKSKYKDMIQSMIVEGAAARIIENALTPLWNQMDSLLESGDTYGAIDYLISGMDSFVDSADRGMNVLWESLKAKGYDMQKLLGDQSSGYTGIKRDIATASEESVTGLAAHMNTVEYYVAQIHQNVAAIATRGGDSPALSGFDYSALIQQSVDRLAMIERYSSEILVECRRNAIAAESALAEIRRVIAPRGTTKSHSIQVTLS